MAEQQSLDVIDVFLRDAERCLRSLPFEHRRRVLAEAENHLRERAAESIASGLSPEKAAAQAVSAFSGARQWAREIMQSTYATRFAPAARLLTLVSAVVLVSVPIVSLITSNMDFWENASAIPILTAEAAFVGVFAGSLLWRQYHTRLLLGVTMIALVSGFAALVIDSQIGLRRDNEESVAFYQQTQRHINQAADTLQFGLSYYQPERQQLVAPARLRDGSKCIVPFDYRTAMYVINGNDAKPARTWSDPFVYSSELKTSPRFNVVATETQAKAVWRAQAPLWLRYGVPYASAKVAFRQRHISTPSISFFFPDFMKEFIYHGVLGMWLLVFLTHFAAVPLGRVIFRWRHRLRRAE